LPRSIRTVSRGGRGIRQPRVLAALAAAVHRNYRERAAGIEGQVKGHELRIDGGYVVVASDVDYAVQVDHADGGYDVRVGDQSFAIRYRWRFGDILMQGTCNGAPFAVQIERRGLQYRLTHAGRNSTRRCCRGVRPSCCASCRRRRRPIARASCCRRCPGCSRSRREAGQDVKAGERLVVIEAMKMQNVIVAERDATVGEVLAKEGDSLAVDQPVIAFK
jgi:propionyl-CoA carboxylase alpha chain